MAEYIERKALRDALYEADAITMVGVKILNQFPAADVAPVVHGRWIGVDYDKCSVCGGLEVGRTNYCPHCGAKMDEVNNGEEKQ